MKDCCVCNSPVEMPNENQWILPSDDEISEMLSNPKIPLPKVQVVCLYCIDDTINKPLVTNN